MIYAWRGPVSVVPEKIKKFRVFRTIFGLSWGKLGDCGLHWLPLEFDLGWIAFRRVFFVSTLFRERCFARHVLAHDIEALKVWGPVDW